MPISGLPPTLQNVINTCLQDKCLSSWKVLGGDQKVIITMCFTSNISLSGKTSPNLPKNKLACHRWFEKCGKNTEIQDEFELLACDSISEKSPESEYNICNSSIDVPNDVFVKDLPESTYTQKLNENENGDAELNTINTHKKVTGAVKSLDSENMRMKINGKTSTPLINQFTGSIDISSTKLDSTAEANELASNPTLKEISKSGLSQSSESLKNSESPKRSALSKFKDTIRGSKMSLNKSNDGSTAELNKNDVGSVSPSKDVNYKLLSKVVKVMKRAATHCDSCQKVIKSTMKLKCTFCDIFLCPDCNYQNKHNTEHKRYISNFIYPHEPTDDYCNSCGYVTKVRHSFNTSFTCAMCPSYQLCQGCMSQGMHGHHGEHLKPYL